MKTLQSAKRTNESSPAINRWDHFITSPLSPGSERLNPFSRPRQPILNAAWKTSVVRSADSKSLLHGYPRTHESVSKLRLPAPKARNVIAWGNAPGKDPSMFEALKARNRKGRPKYAVIAQPPRLFRAFSAKSLHLISPGPMAQALTFCAFGAGKRSFDTGTQVLGYCQPSAPQSRGLYDRENKYYYHGGDLQGVINRLGYLKDLGVTAIWLTPWYDNYDRLNEIELKEGKPCTGFHGYNPQDFYTVEEHFGTLRKLRELVAAAHRLGIKVIQDEVANHTGPYHPWVGNPPTPTWFNGTRAHPAEPKRRRQLQRMEDDKCKNHV